MSRHMGCEHSMTICNHVHYKIITLGGPHTAMLGLPSHNPDTIASSEDAQRPILVENSVKIQTAGFNPIGEHHSFLVLWIQIRSTTRWIPAWTILRDFTWKTPIYQSMMRNGPCLLKFFKQPFRNELSQLFAILCLYKSQVPISKKIHLGGLCLIHHISNPSKTQKNLFIVVNYVHLGLFCRHMLLLEMLVLSNFSRPSSCWWIFLSVNGTPFLVVLRC